MKKHELVEQTVSLSADTPVLNVVRRRFNFNYTHLFLLGLNPPIIWGISFYPDTLQSDATWALWELNRRNLKYINNNIFYFAWQKHEQKSVWSTIWIQIVRTCIISLVAGLTVISHLLYRCPHKTYPDQSNTYMCLTTLCIALMWFLFTRLVDNLSICPSIS